MVENELRDRLLSEDFYEREAAILEIVNMAKVGDLPHPICLDLYEELTVGRLSFVIDISRDPDLVSMLSDLRDYLHDNRQAPLTFKGGFAKMPTLVDSDFYVFDVASGQDQKLNLGDVFIVDNNAYLIGDNELILLEYGEQTICKGTEYRSESPGAGNERSSDICVLEETL